MAKEKIRLEEAKKILVGKKIKDIWIDDNDYVRIIAGDATGDVNIMVYDSEQYYSQYGLCIDDKELEQE